MAETFHGPWWLEVNFGATHANERFTISGSDSSDGTFTKREFDAGQGSGPSTISGAQWTITVEYSPFGFLGVGQVGPFVIGNWYPSNTPRGASFTLEDSLVVTLNADYSHSPDYAQRPDYNGRAIILTLKSLNPAHHPWPPIVNPLNFTLPRETLGKFRMPKPHRTIPGK